MKISGRLAMSVTRASGLAVLSFLFAAGSVSTAFAAALTPEETVKEIVTKIKAAANPSPIVDYVDWDGAFDSVPPQQREVMKINSVKEMRETYKKILEDPITAMKERMKEQIGKLPEAQRAQAETQLVQMEKMITDQKAKMAEQIQKTEYEVGAAKIEGESATVKLTQSFDGQKRDEDIKLVKKDGKWLLSSLDMFRGRPAGPPPGAGAPPAGAPHGMPPVTKEGSAKSEVVPMEKSEAGKAAPETK